MLREMNVDRTTLIAAVAKQVGYRPLPEHQQVPYGWRALAVGLGSVIQLEFDPSELQGEGLLRLTVIMDKRADVRVAAYYAGSEVKIGDFDLKVPYMYEMVELQLDDEQCTRALRDGVELRLADNNPDLDDVDSAVWFYAGDADNGLEYFRPHIALRASSGSTEVWNEALGRLCSYASLQPFGWMEGCVLEGLTAVKNYLPEWSGKAEATLNAHLDLYFSAHAMRFENPRGKALRNQWNGTESTFMAAALIRRDPYHFAVDKAIEFWKSTVDEGGRCITPSFTCEGCLTLAYPLALAGVLRQEKQLVEMAMTHLLARRDWLVNDEGIWLRSNSETGERTYPNWMRGVAWYLLGIGKVLETVPADTPRRDEVAAELRRAVAWVLTLPRENGLWYCFGHRPETGPETSGTAGITAALFRAGQLGLVDAEGMAVARECLQALTGHLSADGFFGGVCQSNKAEGGIALQEQGYRVRSQFGLGLALEGYALHAAGA